MADETYRPVAARPPSWTWVLLLGLPGALIASAIAKGRGLTLRRELWAAAWAISGVGVVLAVVLSLTVRPSSPNFTSATGAAFSAPDYGGVQTPFVTTPTPAPTAGLSSTDTATWHDDQGYSFSATISLGHVMAFQPGLSTTGPQGQGPLVAGAPCQLVPGVDAVVPSYISVTNTTAAYVSDITYAVVFDEQQPSNLQYPATPVPGLVWSKITDHGVPLVEEGSSSGPSCSDSDLTNGMNVSCPQVQPAHSCYTLFFIVLKNFYGPLHQQGDLAQLDNLGLTLDVPHAHYGGILPSFPNTMSGPDVSCDAAGGCAIPLKGFAS